MAPDGGAGGQHVNRSTTWVELTWDVAESSALDEHTRELLVAKLGPAVRIVVDDLHDTGIFAWEYLQQLGRTQEMVWEDYLREIEAQGLSRDP